MYKDLFQKIKNLEDEIKENERKIQDSISKDENGSVSKYTSVIHSDLKYLNILVNGSPLEPKEYRQVMDFIRIHYENLWRIPVQV